MGRLFCLMGKSGSGKDTVFKKLLNDGELTLSPVVSYTTRPRRDSEKDGREYRFITDEELDEYKTAGKIIEMRRYDTVRGVWYYATVDDGQIDLASGDYLTIATLEAYDGLKKRFGGLVVPLYITVEDGERLTRALGREKKQRSPDYCELCRRFLADQEDFSALRLQEAGVKRAFSNENLADCIAEIKKVILK
jgi:Guanylate kinase